MQPKSICSSSHYFRFYELEYNCDYKTFKWFSKPPFYLCVSIYVFIYVFVCLFTYLWLYIHSITSYNLKGINFYRLLILLILEIYANLGNFISWIYRRRKFRRNLVSRIQEIYKFRGNSISRIKNFIWPRKGLTASQRIRSAMEATPGTPEDDAKENTKWKGPYCHWLDCNVIKCSLILKPCFHCANHFPCEF